MVSADDLRKEVAKKRAAVTRKIQRYRRIGVALVGTSFDPRRPVERTKRYNSKQLSAYLSELNGFIDRGNQYFAGSHGSPIPRQEWNSYKRVELEYNARRRAYEASVNNVEFEGNTFELRKAQLAHPGRGAAGEVYPEINRRPSDVRDSESLARLLEDLKNRMTPGYIERRIRNQRAGVRKMLEIMGENILSDQIDELSDYQFDLMWFGPTGAAADLKLNYARAKEALAGITRPKEVIVGVEEAYDEFKDILKWSGEQPKDRPTE